MEHAIRASCRSERLAGSRVIADPNSPADPGSPANSSSSQKGSVAPTAEQGFSMFANKGWLTKEDGGGLDKPVLGVR